MGKQCNFKTNPREMSMEHDPVSPSNTPDAVFVPASLERLPSGWKPAPGVAPEALTAARQALAQTLLSGMESQQIHAAATRLKTETPADPRLSSELRALADDAIRAPRPRTMAVIRSPLAATAENPTGLPEWAR